MIRRRSVLVSLACFVALAVTGCGPQDSVSSASPDALLGSYSLDVEASVEASLPVWNAEMSKRADKEIADLVASPPAMIKTMRAKQREEVEMSESMLRSKFGRMIVDLTLAKRRAFELRSKVPEVQEDNCSGLWTVENDELFLIRDTVDGEALEQNSSLRLSTAEGELRLRWPGLVYVFVLRRG